MSTLMAGELEARLRRLGRAWAWILAFGIVSIGVHVRGRMGALAVTAVPSSSSARSSITS